MMISHFINQILFSFLEQRAIPLPLLPSTLGGGLHFHPTWDRCSGEGESRYNFRENGHITRLLPTGFPTGLCSHRARLPGAMFPVARRLVWEWGNNSLKREGGREGRLVFAQCQTRGERQKFMGVGRVRGSLRGKSRKWSESPLPGR